MGKAHHVPESLASNTRENEVKVAVAVVAAAAAVKMSEYGPAVLARRGTVA